MTPSERSLLHHVGVIILNNLARLTVYTLLYGVFILLTWISVRASVQRGLNSRPKWMMLGVTLICFVLASLFWFAYLAGFVIQIQRIFVDDPLPDGPRLEAINREIFPLEEIQYWTLLLAPLISDSVVIWRAGVIFGEQRWVMIGPLALLLGTTGTSLTYAVVTSRYSTIVADQVGHNEFTINLYNSFLALSLATNAIATLLILCKLWTLRRLMGVFSLQRLTRVQRVLVILVESGVAFCLLQAISLILNFFSFAIDSPSYVAETTIVAIYTFITPMYPTMVVVMVNQQSTIVETFGFTIAQQSKADFDIEIAKPPLGTASMDENTFFDSSPAYMVATDSLPSQKTRTCSPTGQESASRDDRGKATAYPLARNDPLQIPPCDWPRIPLHGLELDRMQ